MIFVLDLKTYDAVFMQFKKEAKDLGYALHYTTVRNEIDQKNKIVRMKYYIYTLNNLYAFCHELGHARGRNPRLTLYHSSRAYRIYSEMKAWVLGYKFVKKYGLPKIAYFRESIPHLKTYIFYKKKKSVY